MPRTPARGPTGRTSPGGRPSGRGRARSTSSRSTPATRSQSSAEPVTPLTQHRGGQWRWAVLAVIVIMLAVLIAPTLRSYINQQSRIDALEVRVAEQELSVADLAKERERWKDPAYVEQQARQRLKFVRVGEKSYTVIDDTASTDPEEAHLVTAPEGAWYEMVWGSVRVADRPLPTAPTVTTPPPASPSSPATPGPSATS